MNPSSYNKILVVDDNAGNLQLLLELLTEKGYTVYPAISGELAMESVKSRLPDLILLDIKMPGLDGYEVCRRLKANDSTRSIPIIFLSALEDQRDKVKGFQAGGVDYITKPFQSEELMARVGVHLRLRELTEGLEQEVSARTLKLRIANKQLEEEVARRQELEDALRESRLRMGNIVFNSPGAIYRCANDEHWTMEFISAAITQITGYPSEDFLHNQVRSLASIIYPDDRQRVVDAVATGLASKDRFEVDYRLVAADGTLRWVHNQGLGVFASDGKLLCLDGILVDITTQRKAEEMLKLSAEPIESS
jgi:PAS domain S-box-containing protein